MTEPAGVATAGAGAEEEDGPAGAVPDADPSAPSPSAPSPLERWLTWATWLVVALGVALRVRQWWADRSFWADEAGLWAVIHHLGYRRLGRPLVSGQAAPIGWLWAEHLVMSIFGDGERAARFLPLLFGCGGLVLAALLARRLMGPLATLVATFLVAWSPLLVYYSNEFKQYSADVFFSVLLLLLGTALVDRATLRRRDAAVLAAVTAGCVWFSHAAVLTAAGVCGALGLLALIGRQWRRLLLLVAAAVPLGVSIAVDYAVALSKTVANDTLQTFWTAGFPPEPLTPGGVTGWIGDSFPRLLDRPLELRHGWLVLTLLGAGLAVLAVRRSRQLVVLLMPLLVLLAAAILHSYPASDRLALFVVPTVLLLLAAPVDLLRRYRTPGRSALAAVPAAAAIAGIAVLAAPSVRDAVTYARHPLQKEETRPTIGYIADHYRPGDLVLFDQFSLPLTVYGPREGLPAGVARVVSVPHRGCVAGQAEKIITGRYRRVWLAWGHDFSGRPAYLRDAYRAHLATIGRKVDSYRVTGAGADLYDLARPPDDPRRTDPLLRAAAGRCLDVRGL